MVGAHSMERTALKGCESVLAYACTLVSAAASGRSTGMVAMHIMGRTDLKGCGFALGHACALCQGGRVGALSRYRRDPHHRAYRSQRMWVRLNADVWV